MAQLIPFPVDRVKRKDWSDEARSEPAEIVIFEGIRYSRQEKKLDGTFIRQPRPETGN